MSGIREPGLGPIIGHTTDHSCRLWIRAGDPEDNGAILAPNRRTVGLLAVTEKQGKKIANPPAFYFRLRREFDRTGDINLGVESGLDDKNKPYTLEPDTEYVVRMATLTIDDPLPGNASMESTALTDRLPDPSVWLEELLTINPDTSEAVFTTFPAEGEKPEKKLSFIVGSCRYPGLLWKVKHADVIFRPLLKETRSNTGGTCPRFVLMVGDQIYADMLNRHIPIGLADTFEEFQSRYLEAFGSPNMRRLLKNIPSYMILDDHEIEDNWSQDRINKDSRKRRLFNMAIGAYMSYQWSHGPRTWIDRLYYHFTCAGYPFFTLDTRTQRYMDLVEGDLNDNHLLGYPSLDPRNEPNQLGRLMNWLETQQKERGNTPKFIVSSSVFAPNPMKARAGSSVRRKEMSDSWPAFPKTRDALLRCILDNRIQNVIFISGDIHCSNIAEIFFSDKDDNPIDLKAFSITSSAFYWPFSFADGEPSHYVHDSRKKGQEDPFLISNKAKMNYRAWNFTQADNYCRVDVDREKQQIKVRAFDKNGKLITEKGDGIRGRRMSGTFKLAPW